MEFENNEACSSTTIATTKTKKAVMEFENNEAYIFDVVIDILDSTLCYSPHGKCLTTASLAICKDCGCKNETLIILEIKLSKHKRNVIRTFPI